jgi:hypothetical protein
MINAENVSAGVVGDKQCTGQCRVLGSQDHGDDRMP